MHCLHHRTSVAYSQKISRARVPAGFGLWSCSADSVTNPFLRGFWTGRKLYDRFSGSVPYKHRKFNYNQGNPVYKDKLRQWTQAWNSGRPLLLQQRISWKKIQGVHRRSVQRLPWQNPHRRSKEKTYRNWSESLSDFKTCRLFKYWLFLYEIQKIHRNDAKGIQTGARFSKRLWYFSGIKACSFQCKNCMEQ